MNLRGHDWIQPGGRVESLFWLRSKEIIEGGMLCGTLVNLLSDTS